MSSFKKGQLVAVRDASNSAWHLRVYDHASPEGLHFCRGIERQDAPCWWNLVEPAEKVWPNIFLGWERRAGEQAADAVAMESALVQRLRKQIGWLCRQIQSIADIEELGNVCPPVGMSPYYNNCQCNCIACWEQASLKAVEEGADGKRDS